jgi:hypothetical protein
VGRKTTGRAEKRPLSSKLREGKENPYNMICTTLFMTSHTSMW